MQPILLNAIPMFNFTGNSVTAPLVSIIMLRERGISGRSISSGDLALGQLCIVGHITTYKSDLMACIVKNK